MSLVIDPTENAVEVPPTSLIDFAQKYGKHGWLHGMETRWSADGSRDYVLLALEVYQLDFASTDYNQCGGRIPQGEWPAYWEAIKQNGKTLVAWWDRLQYNVAAGNKCWLGQEHPDYARIVKLPMLDYI